MSASGQASTGVAKDLVRGGTGRATKAPTGVGVGRGSAHSPEKKEFLYQNGEFWCILGSN